VSPNGAHRFCRAFLVEDSSGQYLKVYEPTGERELGHGAFGWVERCQHRPTGQLRAVKRVPKRSASVLARARREVEVMRALDHPNIARLHEVFEDSRYLYMSMELCDGGELEERVAAAGQLEEHLAALVMQQLFSAVHYMHSSHHLAHRDLKPENCVLAGDRTAHLKDCEVKLIDFGMACVCQPGSSMHNIVGSKAYAAPEVWSEDYGLECDVWSLGMLLHELLSGCLPRNWDVPVDAPAWTHVSGSAKELVRGMLQRDPEERWQLQRCVEHPWVQGSTAQQGAPLLHRDVVANMKHYAQSTVLKKAALQVMATQMSEQQIRSLGQTFRRLDANQDGVLTLREMREGVIGTPAEKVCGDLELLFEQLDTDGDGHLQYTEFLAGALCARRFLCEDLAWAAFQRFDQDGNGRITTQELAKALGAEAGGLDEDLAAVMGAADRDGDGTIDFNDFIEALSDEVNSARMAAVESEPQGSTQKGCKVVSRKRLPTAVISDTDNANAQAMAATRLKKRPCAAISNTRKAGSYVQKRPAHR